MLVLQIPSLSSSALTHSSILSPCPYAWPSTQCSLINSLAPYNRLCKLTAQRWRVPKFYLPPVLNCFCLIFIHWGVTWHLFIEFEQLFCFCRNECLWKISKENIHLNAEESTVPLCDLKSFWPCILLSKMLSIHCVVKRSIHTVLKTDVQMLVVINYVCCVEQVVQMA